MNSASHQSTSTRECCAEPLAPAVIDASSRGPVLLLTGSSLVWLVLGSLLALIAAIKMHKGDFLADCPWFTFGRLRPAQTHIFLYGFASQAALGATLWMLGRLGKTSIVGPFLAFGGALVWNLGVLIGTIGILGGDLSGFENIDMPKYAAGVLFFAYIAIALSAVLTLAFRREKELSVSQWFLLAALLVFPWIFSTAGMLLLCHPVRGVTQAAINYWFSSSFQNLWLAPIAIATAFYLIPVITGRAEYNRQLAIVSFWMLVLVGGWCGVPPGARLPAWMPALSTVAKILMVVPVIAIIVNLRKTAAGYTNKDSISLKFVNFGVLMFGIAAVVAAICSIGNIGGVLEFTLFSTAVTQLMVYGFVSMALFGAIYYFAPLIAGAEWCAGRAKAHFALSSLGIVLIVAGFAVAGFIQGKVQSSSEEFIVSVKRTAPFIGIATLGVLLLLAAHIVALTNFLSIVRRGCCGCFCKGNETNVKTRRAS